MDIKRRFLSTLLHPRLQLKINFRKSIFAPQVQILSSLQCLHGTYGWGMKSGTGGVNREGSGYRYEEVP